MTIAMALIRVWIVMENISVKNDIVYLAYHLFDNSLDI